MTAVFAVGSIAFKGLFRAGAKSVAGKVIGAEVTEQMLRNGADPELLAKSIRRLQRLHVADDVIRSIAENVGSEGFNVDDCIINMKEHPTIKEICEIKYIDYPKTVYDIDIISDELIIMWGCEAMDSGTVIGRNIYGYSSNGLRFEGYIDPITEEVTNFYPVFE